MSKSEQKFSDLVILKAQKEQKRETTFWKCHMSLLKEVSESNEFKAPPRLKSPKHRFRLSAGFNLEQFITNLKVEPTKFEPRLKFKPWLKFIKFGLCFTMKCRK